jgi:tetratricopeptide (TPR) repeat protein
MEDNLLPISKGQCIECHTNPPLPGYPMELCADCRDDFNRYPIPRWLWLFATGILLLMVIGLFRMPEYLSASVHLRRAEKAIEQHKYITAHKEADKVLERFPHLIEANGYKLIASANMSNIDFKGAQVASLELQDREIEDKDLLEEMNNAVDKMSNLVPTDTVLMTRVDNFLSYPSSIQINYLDSMDAGVRNSDKVIFGYLLANRLYEKNEYKTVIALLDKTIKLSPDDYTVMALRVAAKHKDGDYNAALSSCDEILAGSPEYTWAIAQKSRILLLQKKDKEAAVWAKKGMDLDPDEPAILEAQAMVDFVSGKKAESNKLLARIRVLEPNTGAGDTIISQRLGKILDGTVTYR